MAKQKSTPKGLRDLKNIPADRWVSDGKTSERKNFLDHSASVGTYKIDQVAVAMTRGNRILAMRSEHENVLKARGMIDIAGAFAIRYARNELLIPSRHKDIIALHGYLSDIRNLARRSTLAKPRELAGFVAREDDVDHPDPEVRVEKSVERAEDTLSSLLENVGSLGAEIDQYLKRYQIKHSASSAEPLTNWFMFSFAGFWHSFTGSWLRKSESTDFKDCLAAGWVDLRFPDPIDRNGSAKPVEDHIRERLAASDLFDHYGGGN